MEECVGRVLIPGNTTAAMRIAGRRVMNSGYSHHGANGFKKALAGWNAAGGDTRADIDDNLSTLRQRCRDLFMGGGLARAAITTNRTNVIGPGLELKPTPDIDILGITADEARAWSRRVKSLFYYMWAGTYECDRMRMNTFHELQQLAFLSWMLSGDVFVLLPLRQRPGSLFDLRIHVIEADRVCDPTPRPRGVDISQGVELLDGEVAAYHIASRHPLAKTTGMSGGGKMTFARVEPYGAETGRRNLLHLMEAERPEQRRGVPLLAPVVEDLKQLARFNEAELLATVLASYYTVFLKSDTQQSPFGEMGIGDADPLPTTNPETDLEMGPAMINVLNPGESIDIADPKRPNTAYEGFVRAISCEIGSAIETPYEILLKLFNTSYTAAQAAKQEFWKRVRMLRGALCSDFCDPIYQEWLIEAVAKGLVDAPGFLDDPLLRAAWCAAEWHGPSSGHMNRSVEVEAAHKAVAYGFSTYARETAELGGGDFEDNVPVLEIETQQLRNAGVLDTPGPALTPSEGATAGI